MIDVYVTTYNRAKLLEKSLKSILNQTYSDFKLTVLDNCSTDNTKQVVESLADNRVIYHRQEKNLGPLGNMNYGLLTSKSKYFIVFHDDDLMMPQMLEKEIKILDENPDICAVSCQAKMIHMDYDPAKITSAHEHILDLTKYTNKSFTESYINKRNVMIFPTIMYRTDFLRKNDIHLKFEAGPSCDVLICMDMERAGGTLGIINEQLACYRGHEDQFSQQTRVDMVRLLYTYMRKDRYYCDILDQNRKGQNRTYRTLLFNETCLFAGKKISKADWKADMDSYKTVLNLNAATKLYSIFVITVCGAFPVITHKLYSVIKDKRGKS